MVRHYANRGIVRKSYQELHGYLAHSKFPYSISKVEVRLSHSNLHLPFHGLEYSQRNLERRMRVAQKVFLVERFLHVSRRPF